MGTCLNHLSHFKDSEYWTTEFGFEAIAKSYKFITKLHLKVVVWLRDALDLIILGI